MQWPAILFTFGCIFSVWGNNLLTEDTSFETGPQNFRYFRSDFSIQTVQGDAAHGNSSLEIDSSVSWVQGRWFYLKKNVDYTISFYARRVSGSDAMQFGIIDLSNWKWFVNKTLQLTDNWKRYSISFRVDRANAPIYPAFLPRGCMIFRIDALQLEEGKETTPYQPGEALSVYPVMNGAGEVIHLPNTPKVKIQIYNAAIEAEQQPFSLQLGIPGTDIEHRQNFNLLPGKTMSLDIELPKTAVSGYYPAQLQVCTRQGKIVKRTEAPFVVTMPFPPPSRDGFFGMQDSPLPRNFLLRIGTSHIRTNDFGWKRFEPTQGNYIPRPPSPPAGFFWQPTLNSDFTPGQIPAWALKPGSNLADPAKTIPYLEYVFRSLRGKAEHLDFINEPDLLLRNVPKNAEYYAELLNTAAPIARKYGIKLMVDVSGVNSDFFERVLRLAHDSIDICAPHPYCSPRIFAADGRYCAPPEKGGFTSNLAAAAALSRKYRKELLIGELGYSLEETLPFHSPEAHRMAAFLARMFLLAKCYPECRYLIWFIGLDRWEAGPYCYGIWRTANGIRPLPAVAAYAQAAHEIDRADNVELLLDSDIKIVRIQKGGKTTYAVWNAGEKASPVSLQKLPPECNARSIYGTPLKGEKLAVTEQPLYLSETSKETILSALKAILDNRPPLTVRGYLSDRNTLKLHLFNRSFRDWQGNLTLLPQNVRKIGLTILRQAAETVTLTLSDTPSRKLTVRLQGKDGRTFEEVVELPEMQKVRRLNVNDLRNFDFQAEMRKGGTICQQTRDYLLPPDPSIPWSGPEDLSHRTLLGWDQDYFYIFCEVRDEEHTNSFTLGNTWRGDSIQIGLDPFNNADGKLAYDADDYEFTFAKDKKPWMHQAPPFQKTPSEAIGVRQIVTRDEENQTTVYRIAIPRNGLRPLKLKAGTVFGFALCVNDLDKGKQRRTMNFGNGITEMKCPALFRKMVLEE
ncbi:sugar-binding protein [Victivallis sp.]|uniref:sugar-binding protein n=1 Tax=Victivallis sp. TaxID=2049020 RepID=UPI003A934B98